MNTIEVGFRRGIKVNGKYLKLGRMEFKYFSLLCISLNRPVTYDQFMDYMYECTEDEPYREVLSVFTYKLRRKLKEVGFPSQNLKTVYVYGYGFRLADNDTTVKLLKVV